MTAGDDVPRDEEEAYARINRIIRNLNHQVTTYIVISLVEEVVPDQLDRQADELAVVFCDVASAEDDTLCCQLAN